MLAAVMGAAGTAVAIEDEIQVYIDDINEPGEYGLETHINTTPRGRKTPDYPGDVPPYRGVRITPEFSRGLTRTLEAGLYLPTTTDPDGNAHFGGAKVRLKWLPIHDAQNGGWYFGTNHELSWLRPAYSDSRDGYELRVIGGYRGRGWLVGANAVPSWSLSPGHRGSPDTTYAYKAMHDIGGGIALGAEYYNGVGTLADRLPGELQGRSFYLIADAERRPWSLNFGVGHGLTPATDNWTLKAIVGYSF